MPSGGGRVVPVPVRPPDPAVDDGADQGVVLSAAVACHPDRLTPARRLLTGLRPVPAVLCVDPEPAGPAVFTRAGALAWRAAPPEATHHLVLEDDVTLAPNFIGRVRALIAASPDAAIGLFANWGSLTGAAARLVAIRGGRWAPVIDEYMPNQGLVLPAAVGRRLADFLAHEADPEVQTDLLILPFLRRIGVRALVPVPNLVEHDALPSLAGNGPQGLRRSCCFGAGLDAGLGAVGQDDWPAYVPYLSTRRAVAGVISTATDRPVCRALVVDVLTRLGSSAGELARAYPLAGAGDPAAATYQVWLVSAAIGAVLGGPGGGRRTDLGRRLDAPVAVSALRTLVPGWLDAIGTQPPSGGPRIDWDDLVRRGIRWGFDRFSQARRLTDDDLAPAPLPGTPTHPMHDQVLRGDG